MTRPTPHNELLTDSPIAFLDLALVIAFAGIANVSLWFAIGSNYAGPITAICTLIFTTCILRHRGIRWANFGMTRPKKLTKLAWQVPIVLIGTVFVGIVAGNFFGLFLSSVDSVSRTGDLEGNFVHFLLWVALGWIVGGFAEEMLMRGFLLNRAESMLGNARCKTPVAVVFQAAMFGLVHYYNRGLQGALTITMVGLALGTFYIWFGRNLWPTILAHGLVDTLSFLEDYLGA